ncbi:MAG: hypothetical protein HDR96_06050 [Bacteroides sp.]|nr:hypothetical protein [Bacteroides sp.]
MEQIIEETVIMIVNYFDSIKWKYDVKEEEDMITFTTGCQRVNEAIYIRVIVLKGRKRNYYILCSPETTIPKEHILKGLRVVNRYNSKAILVNAFLYEESGNIVFWRQHESNETIPEADFIDYLESVVDITDLETAQIFKDTLSMKDDDQPKNPPRRKGFFGRFF